MQTLDKKMSVISDRIFATAGIRVQPIYYSAGFYDKDENKQYPPYNINKLYSLILSHTPRQKRLVYINKTNEGITKGSSDGRADYAQEVENSYLDSIIDGIAIVAKKVLPVPDVVIDIAAKAGKKIVSWITSWF